jgi:hypothetical protein
MTLVEGLRVFLAASPGVTALTGAQNLFPAQGQQSTGEPRIVYKRTAEVDDDTLDRGKTKSPTATIELECYGGRWGPGYTTARQLADATLNADGGLGGLTMKHYRGLFGTVQVQSCRNDEDVDEEQTAVDATGRGEMSVKLTFKIAYIKQP